MDFSKRLIKLREDKNLTQYEVANRLGIKRPRYNAWEQGLSRPRPEMLTKLADFFDVTPDFLLGFEKTDSNQVPDWATAKDIADFRTMLENDQPVLFDGMPIEGEKRQRVLDILTGLFWEAKELNKETYGRKRNKTKDTSDDNKV